MVSSGGLTIVSVTKAQDKDRGNKSPALSHVLSLIPSSSLINVLNFTSTSVILHWGLFLPPGQLAMSGDFFVTLARRWRQKEGATDV